MLQVQHQLNDSSIPLQMNQSLNHIPGNAASSKKLAAVESWRHVETLELKNSVELTIFDQ